MMKKGKQYSWENIPQDAIADLVSSMNLYRSSVGLPEMSSADVRAEMQDKAIAFEETNGEPPKWVVLPAKTRKTRRDRWMKEVKRSGKSSSN